MKVSIVGGGPGGLFLALLTKKARPDWTIEIFEQNRADDTFGFGVVFSDDTLDEFLSRDRDSYERIRDSVEDVQTLGPPQLRDAAGAQPSAQGVEVEGPVP